MRGTGENENSFRWDRWPCSESAHRRNPPVFNVKHAHAQSYKTTPYPGTYIHRYTSPDMVFPVYVQPRPLPDLTVVQACVANYETTHWP